MTTAERSRRYRTSHPDRTRYPKIVAEGHALTAAELTMLTIYAATGDQQTILALLDVVEATLRLSKVLDLASSVHTPERRLARLALRAALAALPEDVLS